MIDHLDPTLIQPGDTLIGSLPVNLAAEVCERGGRYLHLSLDLPAPLRGQELNARQMRACGARIEEYRGGGATCARLTAILQACRPRTNEVHKASPRADRFTVPNVQHGCLPMRSNPLTFDPFVAALLNTGCATVTRGTNDTLVIETDPPGADVKLSNGMVGKTPATFKLPRKESLVVDLHKVGFEAVKVNVQPQISGAGGAGLAGNVLFGGIIGVAVDAAPGR